MIRNFHHRSADPYPMLRRFIRNYSRFEILKTAKQIDRRKWEAHQTRSQAIVDLDNKLQQNYDKHHQAMVDILANEENRQALFGDLLYKELPEDWGQNGEFTYHDDIRFTIDMLVTWMVNTLVVDLNVQSMFYSSTNLHSGLYRDVIGHLQDPMLKEQLRKSLQEAKEVAPQTLVEQFASSEYFNSIEVYRTYFMHFKSGQCHTYADSDARMEIGCHHGIYFHSPTTSDEEYITKIDSAFAKFSAQQKRQQLMMADEGYCEYCSNPTQENYFKLTEISKAYARARPHNHQHLELLAEVIVILINCHRFTPTPSLFGYLVDKFDSHGMNNYASMVLRCIPDYGDNASVLVDVAGDSMYSHLQARHFLAAVISGPDCLGPLVKYFASHGHTDTFFQLLSFFGLDEVLTHEKTLSKSNLHSLLAKSRFSRHTCDRHLDMDSLLFQSPVPVTASTNTIYQAMEGCVKIGQFGLVDSLFNKIVMHQTRDGRVALAFGAGHQSESDLVLAQRPSVSELGSMLFTGPVLRIMMETAMASSDLGRLMWLVPHMDDFIDRTLAGTTIEDAIDEGLLERQLISTWKRALEQFGLEGKLQRHKKLFAQM